ncbi:nucleotidyl transferase AbiEii/AbiGii toxin family protein [candidate division WOR-3 bacterium]|nr:nucleotidyl transferase AbiEii/AbiGii toxin family protein [candidate division WOR-3 bacterium]
MLDIRQIESFYPEHLKPFKRNLLREYIQYKILEVIFDSKFGEQLSFMGGTAARIIHSNTRFSEVLNFDNRGLEEKDFDQLVMIIQKKLQLEAYAIETRNVFKGAYRSYIKISNILFENGLSNHREEKMLIEVDAEPQGFSYRSDKIILNKFDVFLRINVVPTDILLSQKLYAILMRKRALGRDFYDAVFLLGKTKPNFDYLKLKLKIRNMKDLEYKLLLKCKDLDFQKLAKDVEPFLFVSGDSKKVLYFCDYINHLIQN